MEQIALADVVRKIVHMASLLTLGAGIILVCIALLVWSMMGLCNAEWQVRYYQLELYALGLTLIIIGVGLGILHISDERWKW